MKAVCVEDWRARARRALPRLVFDYLDGGAGDESALLRNRSAFKEIRIIPRVLQGIAAPSLGTKVFGEPWSAPIALAPTGLNGLLRPQGDSILATAAARRGLPFTLSTAANASIAEVARAARRPPWFQLYVLDRELSARWVDSALVQHCPVLVVTVDVPVGGKRLRDLRNRFENPPPATPRVMADIASRPGWALRHAMAPGATQFAMMDGAGRIDQKQRLASRRFDALNWDDLRRLRDRWPRKLLLKGILHPEDAEVAVRCGVDGLVVSNHGGRQLDSAPAPVAVLPEIVAVAGGRTAVLLDGGVRSGEDVLKALLLGADAVMIGRPALYGLAAGGLHGVEAVLELLCDELKRAMLLAGVPDFQPSSPQDRTFTQRPSATSRPSLPSVQQ